MLCSYADLCYSICTVLCGRYCVIQHSCCNTNKTTDITTNNVLYNSIRRFMTYSVCVSSLITRERSVRPCSAFHGSSSYGFRRKKIRDVGKARGQKISIFHFWRQRPSTREPRCWASLAYGQHYRWASPLAADTLSDSTGQQGSTEQTRDGAGLKLCVNVLVVIVKFEGLNAPGGGQLVPAKSCTCQLLPKSYAFVD